MKKLKPRKTAIEKIVDRICNTSASEAEKIQHLKTLSNLALLKVCEIEIKQCEDLQVWNMNQDMNNL
jgi:hypothetical protein